MKNIDLNPGGVIGVVVIIVAAVAIVGIVKWFDLMAPKWLSDDQHLANQMVLVAWGVSVSLVILLLSRDNVVQAFRTGVITACFTVSFALAWCLWCFWTLPPIYDDRSGKFEKAFFLSGVIGSIVGALVSEKISRNAEKIQTGILITDE